MRYEFFNVLVTSNKHIQISYNDVVSKKLNIQVFILGGGKNSITKDFEFITRNL